MKVTQSLLLCPANSSLILIPPTTLCVLDAIILNNEAMLRHFLQLRLLNPPNPLNDWYERICKNDPYAIYASDLCGYLDQDNFDNDSPMRLAASLNKHHFIWIMRTEFNFELPFDIDAWASQNNHFETFKFIVEHNDASFLARNYDEAQEHFENFHNIEALEYLLRHELEALGM